MKTKVSRRAHFNAAHRLHIQQWSEQKNKDFFGICNSPNFHGHNYKLEVKVIGEIDPETGFVVELKWLNSIIQKEIIARFDHRNLNLDTKEFKNLNPTVENIAAVIYTILKQRLDKSLELQIKLYETEKNIVEYPYSL